MRLMGGQMDQGCPKDARAKSSGAFRGVQGCPEDARAESSGVFRSVRGANMEAKRPKLVYGIQ